MKGSDARTGSGASVPFDQYNDRCDMSHPVSARFNQKGKTRGGGKGDSFKRGNKDGKEPKGVPARPSAAEDMEGKKSKEFGRPPFISAQEEYEGTVGKSGAWYKGPKPLPLRCVA